MNRWMLPLSALLMWAAPVLAADLAKIDRTIAGEPAYQSRPKYCLVAFGVDAGTRVWLVLDGEVLYVDRNGNGDLTEEDERFTGETTAGDARPSYPFAEIRMFPAIEQIAADGDTRYTRFGVVHTTIKKDFTPTNAANRELKARYEDDPTLTRMGVEVRAGDVRVQIVSEWADRPGNAPVCRIGGPLTMAPLQYQELQRGEEPDDVQFCLGYRGLGRRPDEAFAIIDYDEVPEDLKPTAEFTFAHKDAGQPPIAVKVTLDRC